MPFERQFSVKVPLYNSFVRKGEIPIFQTFYSRNMPGPENVKYQVVRGEGRIV